MSYALLREGSVKLFHIPLRVFGPVSDVMMCREFVAVVAPQLSQNLISRLAPTVKLLWGAGSLIKKKKLESQDEIMITGDLRTTMSLWTSTHLSITKRRQPPHAEMEKF